MPAPRNRRHIVVGTAPEAEPFTPHTSGRAPVFTRPSDRPQHAAVLTLALETANIEAVEMRKQTPLAVEGAHTGRYIEFEGPLGVDLKIDSLDLQVAGSRWWPSIRAEKSIKRRLPNEPLCSFRTANWTSF